MVAYEVINQLKDSEPDRKVEFIMQDKIIVYADSHLLRIVMENLIGNAWKFTSKKTKAYIEIRKQQQGKSTVYFVRDNGAGFNMEYIKKMFGSFQRLHPEHEFPGTGIGLAIVKRIINRHNGKIWAESEVGKGATFYFTIPENIK
jgi:light-regulated signal transduction histidine kinase (bacteriophytochrome)